MAASSASPSTASPSASSSPLARDAAGRSEALGLRLMVAGGLLLGTLGVFVEEAGQDPITTVWFRCAFGLATLLGWGAVTGRLGELRLRGRASALAIAAGLLMMFNWALFFAAIQRTSIAVATVAFHVQPFWVMALGAWWMHETVAPRQWAAAAVALAGLALATGLVSVRGAAALDARALWGIAFCVGGSLSYALVTLIAKAARGITPFALAWWQCAVGTVVFAAWPLVHGWPSVGAAWGWLAGLGILHTGLAYVILYAGMSRLSAGRIAVLQFVYPATAVVVDAVVYGRVLGAVQMAGVALMAAALWTLRSDAGRPQPGPSEARRDGRPG